MCPNASLQPKLLLHNLFNFGHFLVYATAFTEWGLSRGLEVHLLGRGLEGSNYQRRFADCPNVLIHDANPKQRLDQRHAEWTSPQFLLQELERMLAAQRELRPQASVFISTDDYLFKGVGINEPNFSFETPTCGLTTFGNRQHYTGYTDAHATRLGRLIETRAPFSMIFTLDEYQALDAGVDSAYLVFLPDIFAEDALGPQAPNIQDSSTHLTSELKNFLDAAVGPVFPILGKFDRRKNNLWILETVAAMPNASCVVLGERIPSEEDGHIEELLTDLRASGRLFECRDFVPEELFHTVLSHDKVPFLPLPYSCHYGSSGIQFMGLAYGKPCLTPSGGLMARRSQEHGLGMIFRAGDRKDFTSRFQELLKRGHAPYHENAERFMRYFSVRARQGYMDRMLDLTLQEAATPLSKSVDASERNIHEVMRLFWKGNAEEALSLIQALLADSPEDAGLLFRLAMILFELGRLDESRNAIRACIELGVADEIDFFVRQQAQGVMEQLDTGDSLAAVQQLKRILELIPQELCADTMNTVLSVPTWQQVGGVFARAGEFSLGEECFRNALLRAPEAYDIRLNLSDVLRYAGRYEESLHELDILESKAPDWPGLFYKQGQVLQSSGKYEMALQCFRQEAEESGHYALAQACIAEINQSQPIVSG